MKLALCVLLSILWFPASQAAEPSEPRAARSVHWGWLAPEAELFCTAMVVEQSVPGSYFMACGWNTGYFGIQELADGRKVILFSVWDPTEGDDPNKVAAGERVECLFSDPAMRIRRFGGEGTGGQCLGDFPWTVGQTNHFLVRAVPDGTKSAYSGYVYDSTKLQWRPLVTFRTRTGGHRLKGLYSFVEDFRRDTQSARATRRARWSDGWAKTAAGDWVALVRARFTASGAEWEARETINAGLTDEGFFLQTGGETKQTLSLRSVVERPTLRLGLPDFKLPASSSPEKGQP